MKHKTEEDFMNKILFETSNEHIATFRCETS